MGAGAADDEGIGESSFGFLDFDECASSFSPADGFSSERFLRAGERIGSGRLSRLLIVVDVPISEVLELEVRAALLTGVAEFADSEAAVGGNELVDDIGSRTVSEVELVEAGELEIETARSELDWLIVEGKDDSAVEETAAETDDDCTDDTTIDR